MFDQDSHETISDSDIAIIGMNCRFPGAQCIDEYWQNLRDGVESITSFSDEELASSGVEYDLVCNPNYVKAGAVIPGIELFDADFFDFAASEAEMIDPQHRLFLECAWEVLESAGYDSESYKGSIGVYAGAGMNTYLYNNLYKNYILSEPARVFQTMITNDKDFLSTKVSYKLNLKGPSITIQTACSTSLVAIHLACQSLLNGECDMALSGAVSVRIPQKTGYLHQEGMILSPDGHCRAFDAKAQGIVVGSGVGVIVLKRLEDAMADGDTVHAVIKGSAINNDGSLKVGFTAPSVDGQSKVIAEAQDVAGVDPETITFIESHGTGTALGDPIEIKALTQAFQLSTQKRGFCAIGSVKTNFGHLDTVAGIAGIMKTVLALKHRQIPPSLHFEQPNPAIDFANSPFYVNTKLSSWNTGEIPRRAGVSSFGIGGTNAHVIIEEAPPMKPSGESRSHQLFVISARTSDSLSKVSANLSKHLQGHPEMNLADVAYTLQMGRKGFNHRRMLVCKSADEAVTSLNTLDPKKTFTHFQDSGERPVVFLFPGQGAQYANMGWELYQEEPTFRNQVDRCSEILKSHLDLDLRYLLYHNLQNSEKERGQEDPLQQTAITQPALFVVEYALARLWMEWGVQPQAMIGHSIGEYVAACLSGVFSLEEALGLVALRGQLIQQLSRGSMLAVTLSEEEIRPYLKNGISLAAVNGPSLCVLSGYTKSIEELQDQLEGQDKACRLLYTSHAFHSEMMDPVLDSFIERVRDVRLNTPQIPYISNVTGSWITNDEATDPDYWVRHLRQTVRFADGVRELLKEPGRIMLEVGPGRTLNTLVMQQAKKIGECQVLSSMRHPQDNVSDVTCVLHALGRLWLTGVPVDWSGFSHHEMRHRISLPTYPFERQRYWIEPREVSKKQSGNTLLVKKPDVDDWFYAPSWKRSPLSTLKQRSVHECNEWLLFLDECGIGTQLAKRLKQLGHKVVTVEAGSVFKKRDETAYCVDPTRQSDYSELFRECSEHGRIPETIVHLWNITMYNQSVSEDEMVNKTQNTGYYSFLFLAQALGKQDSPKEYQIIVLSNNIQDILGEEDLCPEKATLLGPIKVVPQEYPNIQCKSIDVVFPLQENDAKQNLVDNLLKECTKKNSDTIIAYRGNYRWVQTYEPVYLEEITGIPARLREGGVYLITGGLGNIGLIVAEYLARKVKARLILTGRADFPPGDTGKLSETLNAENNDISHKVEKLRELENVGAEVLVLKADVASLQQMQEVITQGEERFGPINGVIHAAGTIGEKTFSLIGEIDKDHCEQQFLPKIQGTLVLNKLLQGKKLDFCLLMSSLASVLGGIGYTAYSAANLFLDAFSCNKRKTEVPWISVNWDAWRFEEEKEQKPSLGSKLEELAITPGEGIEALNRMLFYDDLKQLVVSTGDLKTRLDQWIYHTDTNVRKQISANLYLRPKLPNAYVPPRNQCEQTIASIWQNLLGLEQVGIYDNFFDLGGHSLLATQVLSRLRDVYWLNLSLRALFEEPTVAGLAEYVENIQSSKDKKHSPIGPITEDREEIKI